MVDPPAEVEAGVRVRWGGWQEGEDELDVISGRKSRGWLESFPLDRKDGVGGPGVAA